MFVYNKENRKQLRKVKFQPKRVNPEDVVIKIEAYVDQIFTLRKADWGSFAKKDLIASHEIVGKVVQVDNDVNNEKVGQIAGIGAPTNFVSSMT